MNLSITPHAMYRPRPRSFRGLGETEDRGITLEERRRVDVTLLVASGSFSVLTLGVFASGNYRLGYTMSMVGGVIGTVVAALRLWSSYDQQIRAREAGQDALDPLAELLS